MIRELEHEKRNISVPLQFLCWIPWIQRYRVIPWSPISSLHHLKYLHHFLSSNLRPDLTKLGGFPPQCPWPKDHWNKTAQELGCLIGVCNNWDTFQQVEVVSALPSRLLGRNLLGLFWVSFKGNTSKTYLTLFGTLEPFSMERSLHINPFICMSTRIVLLILKTNDSIRK